MSHDLLKAFILARNARRSSEHAAQGFRSGKSIYNLKADTDRENAALFALADWVEEQGRVALLRDEKPELAAPAIITPTFIAKVITAMQLRESVAPNAIVQCLSWALQRIRALERCIDMIVLCAEDGNVANE